MPIVICSYCHYVGQSKGKYRVFEEELADVEKHEETCSERIALREKP